MDELRPFVHATWCHWNMTRPWIGGKPRHRRACTGTTSWPCRQSGNTEAHLLSEGPSSQYFRHLIPKIMKRMVLEARDHKSWVQGAFGYGMETLPIPHLDTHAAPHIRPRRGIRGSGSPGNLPEGPSTQGLPRGSKHPMFNDSGSKIILLIVFGTRVPKCFCTWTLGVLKCKPKP